MGYTHYWEFKKPPKNKAIFAEKQYQLALRQCNRLLKRYNKHVKSIDPTSPDRLSGYSVHSKGYGGLMFNGTAELSREDFTLREHYNQNDSGFCKTAHKPYDVMVTACLILLKHYLGDLIAVSSDGYRHDWYKGLGAIIVLLKLTKVKIPASIKSITERNTA